MNDLVVKISGEIVESNFDSYQAGIIKIIKGADRELVTDADFIEASRVVKICKAAEMAIKDAKQAAIAQTVDIKKLFAKMDEVSDVVRTVRLSREKKIKTEQESRKNCIVTAGIKAVEAKIDRVADKFPQIKWIYSLDKHLFETSAKGRKTTATIQAAIDEKVQREIETIDKTILIIADNLEQIEKAESEFPGLFPDKNTICGDQFETVKNLIESRVANFKLKQLEAENKKKADALDAKRAEEAEKLPDDVPLILESLKEQTEIEPSPGIEPETIPIYLLTITIESTKNEAIEIAERIAASLVTENLVSCIALTNFNLEN